MVERGRVVRTTGGTDSQGRRSGICEGFNEENELVYRAIFDPNLKSDKPPDFKGSYAVNLSIRYHPHPYSAYMQKPGEILIIDTRMNRETNDAAFYFYDQDFKLKYRIHR